MGASASLSMWKGPLTGPSFVFVRRKPPSPRKRGEGSRNTLHRIRDTRQGDGACRTAFNTLRLSAAYSAG